MAEPSTAGLDGRLPQKGQRGRARSLRKSSRYPSTTPPNLSMSIFWYFFRSIPLESSSQSSMNFPATKSSQDASIRLTPIELSPKDIFISQSFISSCATRTDSLAWGVFGAMIVNLPAAFRRTHADGMPTLLQIMSAESSDMSETAKDRPRRILERFLPVSPPSLKTKLWIP